MTAYLRMWKNYKNFSGRTTIEGFWMAVLINLIVELLLFFSLLINPFFILVFGLYVVAVFIPELSLTIRRLRDAGIAWYYFCCCLIPVVGVLILLVLLCMPSVPENGMPE